MTNSNLNQRALRVLRVLVEQYLNEGQPVSSKCLAQVKDISASSATVRNIMMTLERAGLLKSPHTSSGRIPTVSGLRFFVNELLTVKEFNHYVREMQYKQLNNSLLKGVSSTELCQQASKLLADVTQLTGLVTVPHKKEVAIDKVEFVQLSDTRLMAIMVMQDGDIQNKILDLSTAIDSQTLTKTSLLMNMVLTGKTLSDGYQQLQAIAKDDVQLKYLSDLTLAHDNDDDSVNHLLVAGESRLLNENISSELTKIRAVFEAIAEKRLVLDIMARCRDENGVKIFIGEETGIELLSECALVSAPYKLNGQVIGSLAVIGPTRMDYRKVIPIVDMTSKLLTSALNQPR